MNFYSLAADVVVCLHFAYVAFVLGGLLAVLLGYLRRWNWVHNRWFRGIHLVLITIVVVEAWCGITCPLTTWEQNLRQAAGESVREGSFVANLVHDLMFFAAPPWVFTFCYTAFGMLVLSTFLLIPPRWQGEERPVPSGKSP